MYWQSHHINTEMGQNIRRSGVPKYSSINCKSVNDIEYLSQQMYIRRAVHFFITLRFYYVMFIIFKEAIFNTNLVTSGEGRHGQMQQSGPVLRVKVESCNLHNMTFSLPNMSVVRSVKWLIPIHMYLKVRGEVRLVEVTKGGCPWEKLRRTIEQFPNLTFCKIL